MTSHTWASLFVLRTYTRQKETLMAAFLLSLQCVGVNLSFSHAFPSLKQRHRSIPDTEGRGGWAQGKPSAQTFQPGSVLLLAPAGIYESRVSLREGKSNSCVFSTTPCKSGKNNYFVFPLPVSDIQGAA